MGTTYAGRGKPSWHWPQLQCLVVILSSARARHVILSGSCGSCIPSYNSSQLPMNGMYEQVHASISISVNCEFDLVLKSRDELEV